MWVKGPFSVSDILLKSTFCQVNIFLRLLEIMSPISATCKISRTLDFEHTYIEKIYHDLVVCS